jgi:hypothetical protein
VRAHLWLGIATMAFISMCFWFSFQKTIELINQNNWDKIIPTHNNTEPYYISLLTLPTTEHLTAVFDRSADDKLTSLNLRKSNPIT